jgi:predicted deacylase
MKDLAIDGKILQPGKLTKVNITISRLPSDTLIDLNIFAFRGKKDGPVLLLTGGIHGDEINGIEIIRRLIKENQLMPDKGTVIAIPLVNVYGFIYNSRELPNGRDLNRCFPGSENGSLANRLAYILMKKIIPLIDLGLDFHTGGNRISNYPQIRCVIDNEANQELAMSFGAPFTLNSELIDKSFRKEAARFGKPILVFEGGEALRLDELSIQEGKNGVYRLMQHLGMKDYNMLPQHTRIMTANSWLRAKTSGIFNAYIEYGAHVYKNQALAAITDPYGKSNQLIKAPHDGHVVGLNNMPVINAGDALIHLGY